MKYLLFAVNIVILVVGIGVVVMGGIGASNNSDFNKIIGEDQNYKAAAYTLIGVGAFLIIFSFFGCFGAIKEIKWMLVIYAIFLTIFFFVLLIAGILGYVIKGNDTEVREEMIKSLRKVKAEADVRQGWDDVQKSFKCCGVDSAADWQPYAGEPYPQSCCKDKDATLPLCEIHAKGCLERFMDGAGYVGAVGIATAVIMFIGLVFTCAVMCKRKSVHYV